MAANPLSVMGSFIQNFWRYMLLLIFRPRVFFQQNHEAMKAGSVRNALFFAIIVKWVSAAINFFWRQIFGSLFADRWNDFMRIFRDMALTRPGVDAENFEVLKEHLFDAFFGAWQVLWSPVTTLFQIIVVSLFIYIALIFLVAERPGYEQRYTTTLNIAAYASAPWVLSLIPGVGWFLSLILSFSVAVVGISEIFGTSKLRASAVLLFPYILLSALPLFFLVGFLAVAFGVIHFII